MSNFIPREPPWIDKTLKNMLNRQQRLYRNYKKHGFKPEDKSRVDVFRSECNMAIKKAKADYLKNLGNKLADPKTRQKCYWKIINRVMNRCRAPKIPPLLVNNTFVLNAKEKAHNFIKHFSNQCKPLINDSKLPDLTYHTEHRLNNIPITNADILAQIVVSA